MDHTFDAPPVDREVLDFAVGLATRAGQMSAQGFFGEWGSHRKEDGSEVTEIDLAVEESVRNELARHMPEDGIYGEEKGSTAGVSGRRWIIDRINGTTSFTRRWPLFSNDIAYEDEYGPAVGVINMPMSRQMVVAGRGLGCWVLIGENPDLVRPPRPRHRADQHARGKDPGAQSGRLAGGTSHRSPPPGLPDGIHGLHR